MINQNIEQTRRSAAHAKKIEGIRLVTLIALILIGTVNANSQTTEAPLKWSGVYELETFPNGTWMMWWEMIDAKGNKSWKISDCSYDPVGTLI